MVGAVCNWLVCYQWKLSATEKLVVKDKTLLVAVCVNAINLD